MWVECYSFIALDYFDSVSLSSLCPVRPVLQRNRKRILPRAVFFWLAKIVVKTPSAEVR